MLNINLFNVLQFTYTICVILITESIIMPVIVEMRQNHNHILYLDVWDVRNHASLIIVTFCHIASYTHIIIEVSASTTCHMCRKSQNIHTSQSISISPNPPKQTCRIDFPLIISIFFLDLIKIYT